MANEKPKAPLEGKFAETLRKSKEKRAGMQKQAELPSKLEQESREGEAKGRLTEPS